MKTLAIVVFGYIAGVLTPNIKVVDIHHLPKIAGFDPVALVFIGLFLLGVTLLYRKRH